MSKHDFFPPDKSDCECERIAANCVDAYFNVANWDVEDPTTLWFSTPWGGAEVDLLPYIRYGETDTHVELGTTTPEEPDNFNWAIMYHSERNVNGLDGRSADCVAVKDIVNHARLEWLGNVAEPSIGNTYVWNSTTSLWDNYDTVGKDAELRNQVDTVSDTVNNYITSNNTRVQQLENRVSELEASISTLLSRIYGWPLSGNDMIATGNVNLYSGALNGNMYIKTRDNGSPTGDIRAA